jgi:antitoxin VapB
MALSIKSPEADRLARELAEKTGESITDAVISAIREKLAREQRKQRNTQRLVEDLMEIARHCASLPVYDSRTSDEILGYGEDGLPS